MKDQAKKFASLRDEASAPLVKLYYEVLNRFHPHDYDAAINAMSGDLRSIIEACNAGFYYYLKEGEIVQEGDECEVSANWNDPPKWVPAGRTVGTPAPDPSYISHRKYRRLIQL